MSKRISFRGTLPTGEEEVIRLATINGKKGYKVTEFKLMSTQPGGHDYEYIGKIHNKLQAAAITTNVEFTDYTMVAVGYIKDDQTNEFPYSESIIFDNSVTNQDMFVHIVDKTGGSIPCNYYIELEEMALSDIETTKLTLQSIRTISG